MPVLGVLLTNLFGGLVAWLTQFVARKVAYATAAVAMMTALSVALIAAFRAALQAFQSAGSGTAHAMFLQGLQMVIPPQAMYMISAWVTLWTACTAYRWQRDLLHVALHAGS